jgi:hypothetical protein
VSFSNYASAFQTFEIKGFCIENVIGLVNIKQDLFHHFQTINHESVRQTTAVSQNSLGTTLDRDPYLLL